MNTFAPGPVGAVCNRTGLECLINSKIYYKQKKRRYMRRFCDKCREGDLNPYGRKGPLDPESSLSTNSNIPARSHCRRCNNCYSLHQTQLVVKEFLLHNNLDSITFTHLCALISPHLTAILPVGSTAATGAYLSSDFPRSPSSLASLTC